MSDNRAKLAGRRAELMAELLLVDLGAIFVSQPVRPDLGYDLLAGFRNDQGGTNNFAIEVQATEKNPAGRYILDRHTHDRMVRSNTPALLLVANVKENRLFYGWLKPERPAGNAKNISIDVRELDDAGRKELRKEMTRSTGYLAAAS